MGCLPLALLVPISFLNSANTWVSKTPSLCASSSFSTLSAISTWRGDDDDEDEMEDEDEFFESVSDAEALLACRAHLQRRNLLGMWVEGEQRKKERRMAMEQAAESDTVGFFWENPDELVYYDRRKRPRFLKEECYTVDMDDLTACDTESENEHQYQPIVADIDEKQLGDASSPDVSDFGSNSWEYSQWTPKVDNDDNIYIEDESLEYYDEEAYLLHQKRSEANKPRFLSPEWKESWYNSRWGGHTKMTEEEQRQRRFNGRVRSEPLKDLLAHPALCEMDEAEIAEAIKTYRTANEKRSKSLLQAYRDRKVFPPEPDEKLPRDCLYKTDKEALAEKRRERSEIARLAYQTRLDNRPRQKVMKKRRKNTKRVASLASSSQQQMDALLKSEPDSPEGSLRRILELLDAGALSLTSNSTLVSVLERDLEAVSQPKKLSGRKGLYRRILNDVFGLRGKCVPADSGMTFVTQSTIPHLYLFVKQNLERVRKDLETS